jgi:hypothetical protein
MIAVSVFPQSFRIPGVSFECDHVSVWAHETCNSQRNTSDVGSDVVDDRSRKDSRTQCTLQNRFVLSSPKSGFSPKVQAHPHPLRYS